MSSEKIRPGFLTTAFKLTAWYSSIFILSSLLLLFLGFHMVAAIVEQQDREQIRLKLNEYIMTARDEGVDDLLEEIKREKKSYRSRGFFVRVTDRDNRTVICSLPRRFKDLNCANIPTLSPDQTSGTHIMERHEDNDLLEITSARLSGDYIIQVGKSSTERDHLIERFYRIFLTIMMFVAPLGLLSGGFLAFKSLSPLRALLRTVHKINEGSLDSRVPVRDGRSSERDELNALGVLFNGMLERIDTLVMGMKEALDYVAHDLRTPVTRLKAIVESALGRDCDRKELEEALLDCAEEADRISVMLSTLMDISEAETGVMRLDLKEEALRPIVLDVAELYEYVAEEKDFSITVKIPEGLRLPMDMNRMRQVFANLMDNAIKYGRPGGRCEIRAFSDGKDVILSFSDNGAGISPEDIPRIFDRLYRGDKSRSEKGLGLGLSLVKAVVEGHVGRVQVESTQDKGTEIRITLPGS